jgi:hypothetical protein
LQTLAKFPNAVLFLRVASRDQLSGRIRAELRSSLRLFLPRQKENSDVAELWWMAVVDAIAI